MRDIIHDDVIKWKHFPRYWPFVRGIPLTKTSNAELLCFFDLRMNNRLSKQSWDWWFETPWRPLWRHCNDTWIYAPQFVLHLYSERSLIKFAMHLVDGLMAYPRLHIRASIRSHAWVITMIGFAVFTAKSSIMCWATHIDNTPIKVWGAFRCYSLCFQKQSSPNLLTVLHDGILKKAKAGHLETYLTGIFR